MNFISSRAWRLPLLLIVLILQSVGFLYAALPNEAVQTGSLASTYVQVESWIYPAFDWPDAAGLVQTAFVGIPPQQCSSPTSQLRGEIADESA